MSGLPGLRGTDHIGFTVPDIEVGIDPAQAAADEDPQLERGIAEILRLLAETPVPEPDFSERPFFGPRPVDQ